MTSNIQHSFSRDEVGISDDDRVVPPIKAMWERACLTRGIQARVVMEKPHRVLPYLITTNTRSTHSCGELMNQKSQYGRHDSPAVHRIEPISSTLARVPE